MTKALTCVVCQHRDTTSGQVCEFDRTRIARTLDEIAELYTMIELAPGQKPGQRITGSREAPLPLLVDPLDLTMPARIPEPTDVARLHPDDQRGLMSVATRLDLWVRYWRTGINVGDINPNPTVADLARWLLIWLDVACDYHPAINDFATELFTLVGVLRHICGTNDVKPEILDVPCSRCDQTSLYRRPGEDRIECGACGRLLTEHQYGQWCGLVAARAQRNAA
jgi:ribosomal protein S27E